MELQWPLILFTSLIAWSAGVFGTHGILVVRGVRTKAHLRLLVCELAIMVVGGIAVFMHLEHWERIFNGFGHITSGITQELIGIVAMVVVMLVMFAQLRRRNDDTLPAWVGVLAIIVAVALVIAMGHSYMMPSRPAWDSVLQLCSLLGAACVMGPATAAVVIAACGEDAGVLWRTAFAGSLVNAVATLGYLASMAAAQQSYTDIGYYYDPAHLARGMIDFEAATGLLSGGRLALVVLVVVLAVVPVLVVFLVKPKKAAGAADGADGSQPEAGAEAKGAEPGEGGADGAALAASGALARRWIPVGCVITLCGLAAAVVLRVVFYELGHAVYIFF